MIRFPMKWTAYMSRCKNEVISNFQIRSAVWTSGFTYHRENFNEASTARTWILRGARWPRLRHVSRGTEFKYLEHVGQSDSEPGKQDKYSCAQTTQRSQDSTTDPCPLARRIAQSVGRGAELRKGDRGATVTHTRRWSEELVFLLLRLASLSSLSLSDDNHLFFYAPHYSN